VPEGDTVFRAARSLDKALSGRTITASDFRVPRYATSDLTGDVVTEVVPRGKHILTRTKDGFTVHTHFMMDGTWRIFKTGEAWRGGPDHEVRLVIGNDQYTAVGYRMPVVDLIPTLEEDQVVGHLGPDIVSDTWDAKEAVRNLMTIPERTISEALLDQRNIAGIGNLYRNEVLFLRGIEPRTPVSNVDDLLALVGLARRLMVANLSHWSQTTTGNSKPSEKHWVFERSGKPCRRCRKPIAFGRVGQSTQARHTYWCPSCQPPEGLRGTG